MDNGKDRMCPSCGRTGVMDNQAARKALWRCPSCACLFGNTEEEGTYRSHMVSYSLTMIGREGRRTDLRLSITPSGAIRFVLREPAGTSHTGDIDAPYWEDFKERLFSIWYLKAWDRSYYGTTDYDGRVWDIRVSFRHKHTIAIHGCNRFPVHWNSMIAFLSPLFIRSGVPVERYTV